MGSSMSSFRAIQTVGRPVFLTRELAALGGASISSASQALGRLEREGLVVRAARGVWCAPSHPRFSPFLLVQHLAGGHRAYVSFFSALYLHGMIEQIPQVVYAATTAHTRKVVTPLGVFSFHRIHPRFFSGFEWHGGHKGYLVATPEKAMVDCLYLSSRKGRRFGRFPEIELGGKFSKGRALDWVTKIPYPRLRRHVLDKLASLLGHRLRVG